MYAPTAAIGTLTTQRLLPQDSITVIDQTPAVPEAEQNDENATVNENTAVLGAERNEETQQALLRRADSLQALSRKFTNIAFCMAYISLIPICIESITVPEADRPRALSYIGGSLDVIAFALVIASVVVDYQETGVRNQSERQPLLA